MNLLLMCLQFFKTGLFSIGGGLATLPFLYEMADKYPWFTREQLSDMIAVSESTPGPVGVNMATYAGYVSAGIPGAVLATFSLVLPSVLIILIVAHFLKRFQDSAVVGWILSALRPVSVGLIAAAGFGLMEIALKFDASAGMAMWVDWKALLLGGVIAALYAVFGKKLHPFFFVLMGAAGGLVMGL